MIWVLTKNLFIKSDKCLFLYINQVVIAVFLLFLQAITPAASSPPFPLPSLLFPLFQGLKHQRVFGKTKTRKSRLWRTKAAFTWGLKMKTLSLIVLVLSFTFATPVTAADKDDRYWVQGRISCGYWVEHRKEDDWPNTANQFWVIGYITAYNKQTPDVYNIMGDTDPTSVYLWLDKYCQENPLNMLVEGMEILTYELWPNRKRTKDD